MNFDILFSNCCKFAQQTDLELSSPEIKVEPADSLIQRAVAKLKEVNPSYFVGVRKIVVDTGSAFGFVQSGGGNDPSIIHINLSKIKSEVQSKLGATSNPKQLEDEIVRQIVIVIAHEKGHIKSYKPETGFSNGEVPAEAEAHFIEPRLK